MLEPVEPSMFMSKTIKLLLCAFTGLLFAHAASAQQTCEPSKVAQKYPSLAGKTIKIGVDPESPPYAFRDSKDFNKIIGADADMARAVFDCAGVKTEFFTAGWPGLLPALRAGPIDVTFRICGTTGTSGIDTVELPRARAQAAKFKAACMTIVNNMSSADIAS